jgi:tryptophan-rich sensory protein
MKLPNIAKLIVSVAVPILVGFFGSLFTTADTLNNWYANLRKPAFTPPEWVFGPVWTTLFILIGIAAFMVWQKGLDNKRVLPALLCFVVQLALNVLWSVLFFGLRSPLGGLIDIVLLMSAIILTVILFRRVSKIAGLLLVPYLLWVMFASILNIAIYIQNR